jgi:hypothetical protein
MFRNRVPQKKMRIKTRFLGKTSKASHYHNLTSLRWKGHGACLLHFPQRSAIFNIRAVQTQGDGSPLAQLKCVFLLLTKAVIGCQQGRGICSTPIQGFKSATWQGFWALALADVTILRYVSELCK